MNKVLLLTIVLLSVCTHSEAQMRRYTEAVFPSSSVISDVVYDTAPFLNFPYHDEDNTTTGDLIMDIYQPTGDAHDLRAAIIFVHAGGFALGNRNHDDMVAFCDSFARMGYVTASIDYRKGFYAITNTAMHSTRAAYRGLQDGRSAVRYLRANASAYGIDTNRIYMAGSSAGAFVALHSVFMTKPDEKPEDAGEVSYSNLILPFFHNGPDLGNFDRGSNLNQDGTPNGIIALWGALFDLDLLEPTENQAVFLAHGSADAIVPYSSGSPFSIPLFPTVYGSELIDSNMDLLGMDQRETYFLSGEGHEFYGTNNGAWDNGTTGNMYWDSLLTRVTPFLWTQHKPTANFAFAKNGLEVDFTDLSIDALAWHWDFGDGNISNSQNPTHLYTEEGNYEVRLFVQNDILSWDEIGIALEVLAPLPLTWLSLNAHYQDKQTVLKWEVAEQVNNERFIVEHSLDGRSFTALGELVVGQDLLEVQAYTFIHPSPPVGRNYYRIKQMDFDGQYTLSRIVSIQVETISWSIQPNPADGYCFVQGHFQNEAQVEVYNLQGKLVLRQPMLESRRIDLGQFSSGIYLIRMQGEPQAQQLIIK
ncbi:MAG: PKD domain-containing protein [Bacteroidota bacterium]